MVWRFLRFLRFHLVYLIGHETINIPDIFSGVHCFQGKPLNPVYVLLSGMPNVMRATEVLLQFSKLDGLHTKVFFMRLFVLKFDPFAKASFYLTFSPSTQWIGSLL